MRLVLLMLVLSLCASFAESAGDRSLCRKRFILFGEYNYPWCAEKPAAASDEAKEAEKKLAENAQRIAAAREKRDREQKEYLADVKKVNRELDQISAEMSKAADTIKKEEKYLLDKDSELSPNKIRISVGKNRVEKPEPLLASVKRLEDAEDRIGDLQKKARDRSDFVDNVFKKEGESVEEYEKRMAELTENGELLSLERENLLFKDRMKAQQNQIAGMRVTDRITKLQIEGLTAEQKIEALQDELDQDLMGVYVREKMAKLLASGAFCDAKKSCETRPDGGLDDPGFVDEKYKSLEKVFSADGRQLLRDATRSSAPPKRSGSAN